jgi:hypothetical protein
MLATDTKEVKIKTELLSPSHQYMCIDVLALC